MDLFRQQFPQTTPDIRPPLPSVDDLLLIGEAYQNPQRFVKSFTSRITGPKKTQMLKLASLLKEQGFGRKVTSAINMAYGKRRNSRSKRLGNRRAPSRKRTYGRRKRIAKRSSGSSTLNVIKKALMGTMAY